MCHENDGTQRDATLTMHLKNLFNTYMQKVNDAPKLAKNSFPYTLRKELKAKRFFFVRNSNGHGKIFSLLLS